MWLNNWRAILLHPFQVKQISCLNAEFSQFSFFCLGLYSAMLAPNDYLQGIYYKIMYVHVPSAWISMGLYVFMASISFIFIVYKIPSLALIAESSSIVGAVFTFITLVTGSIWGMPHGNLVDLGCASYINVSSFIYIHFMHSTPCKFYNRFWQRHYSLFFCVWINKYTYYQILS